MKYALAQTLGIPAWAPEDSRSWTLIYNSLWLSGKAYKGLQYSFNDKKSNSGRVLEMYQKRPSIQMNIPRMASDILSQKTFGSKHIAHVNVGNNKDQKESIEWLIETARLDEKMLDTNLFGQAGSVAVVAKIANDKPCVEVFQGKFCFPTLNDDETVARLVVAYPVDGQHFINLGVNYDGDGQTIAPSETYWFIRCWDENVVATLVPQAYDSWNPVSGIPVEHLAVLGNAPLTQAHGFGECPVVWIKNQPGKDDPGNIDGMGLFDLVLDNCIHTDYSLSSLGKGINYMGQPQLAVIGKRQGEEGRHQMGSGNILHLQAERRSGEDQQGRGDAKILEMTGSGVKIGLENFCEKMRQMTLEIMSISRKNPDTIQGAMSGKAMELIDEEFVDKVEMNQLRYGKYGFLQLIKLFCRILLKLNHPKFKSFSLDAIDDIKLEWPRLYSASPQEAQFLIQGAISAVERGMMTMTEGKTWLMSQIGRTSELFDIDVDSNDPDDELKPPMGPLDPNPPDPVAQTGTKPATKPKAKAGK